MISKYKIVLVEDEEKISDMVRDYLEREGMRVFAAGEGEVGLELIKDNRPDLVLLDIMLPDMSGLEICSILRHEMNVPVILLTARSQETDRVVGLELGADDYIVKPFSLAELSARIRAVMRRVKDREDKPKEMSSTIKRGNLLVDIENHLVKLSDNHINLTPTEFKMLSLMASNPGRVYSRLQLLEACLGEAYSGYERSIDTHIRNLRKKIEKDPANPAYIVTVFGLGYKFAMDN